MPSHTPSPILTLWDIDGTLINIYKYHTPAYQKAIKKAYGVFISAQEIESNYGLPAREVIEIHLRKRGISEKIIKAQSHLVRTTYVRELMKNLSKAPIKQMVLPGVEKLLRAMQSAHIPMGIVTGNITRAGEGILKKTTLARYFDNQINSFGDNALHRSRIVAQAIKNAKKEGLCNAKTKIVVFGDMPADVEAAKAHGCISIAVIKDSNKRDSSRGGESYTKRKRMLQKAKPDYLLDDFTHTQEILALLTSLQNKRK